MGNGDKAGPPEGPFLIDSLKKSSAKRDFSDRLTKVDAGVAETGAPGILGDQTMIKIHAPLPAGRQVTIAFPDVCKTPAVQFAEGTFNPGSAQGRELLAHELAHAVQQRKRRDDR